MDPFAQQLPSTLRDWCDRKPYNYLGDWYKPWENLRTFFHECGYDLFVRDLEVCSISLTAHLLLHWTPLSFMEIGVI